MSRLRSRLKSTLNTVREHGFTLLEAVLTVAIILVLSVGGYFGYQHFTERAKISAVESVANEVFTAAMAQLMLPAENVSLKEAEEQHKEYAQLASYQTAAASSDAIVSKIEEDYNSQNDDIKVEIEYDNIDLTVTAVGWGGEYSATRSTIVEDDGVVLTPGDQEKEEPVEEPSQCENPENGCMVMTWDVSKSDYEVKLPMTSRKVSNSAEIDWGDGTITRGNTLSHTYNVSDDSIYTIRIAGTFESFGNIHDKSGLLSVDEWRNTETTNLSDAFRMAEDLTYIHEIPNGVEDMSHMFRGLTTFNQDIGDWDTSTVTDMSYMFYNTQSFNQDISDWDVSNVTTMAGMFGSTNAFNNGNATLDWEETSQVKYMQGMFNNATSFDHDVSDWDVSNVESMSRMFSGDIAFNNGGEPLDWNSTANVASMTYMFYENTGFNQDISMWDMSSVTNMEYMFRYATAFNNGGKPLKWTDMSSVSRATGAFSGATAFNQDVSSWNMPNVERIQSMFSGATSFNNGGQALDWNIGSGVTSLHKVFYNARDFNQDISDWNISGVETMEYMFGDARAFNNGGEPLDWSDTSSLTSTRYMFASAQAFNQDISSWDVSRVTNMERMFSGAHAFNNGGEPLEWQKTSSLKNMDYMFNHAYSFNQNIGSWDVSSVTTMQDTFTYASEFNQDISRWNVSNVSDMTRMFQGASSFNQDLSSWKVPHIYDRPDGFNNGTPEDFQKNAAKQPQWGVA